LNGRSPFAFAYTSCPERRAIGVYVYAASQPVRQRKLAKFFTRIFHLVFSFVLIMIQCPASGCSALIGLFTIHCSALAISRRGSATGTMTFQCFIL
jgi:hypothetical protein